ncbi:MAG: BMP family ABC transporter substrate-binding protein [Actinomycetota bacterium]|nr:BMP family ABC transporter substrate-binding protein [Actinomycetota bacterium]
MVTRVVLSAAVALVAAACGGDGGGGPGGGGRRAGCAEDQFCVGVALDVGGLGDQSFNDAAKRGLDEAIAEGFVEEDNTEFIEANATGSNRDANITSLADQGYDLIVGVGFAFSEGVAEIAGDYPDQSFAVVDGFATTIAEEADNIVDLTFKEHEGSFLVGAAAAMASEAGTIGFLGGQRGPLIGKFEAGYVAGAQAIDPDIEILVEYIGDDVTAFNDPTKGEALSQSMYDEGADVIYHAAGASGAGLFQAAVAADALAIGVDSDQYLTASEEQKPHILTSMLKRVDTAVRDVIEEAANDRFEPGFKVFGMAEDGVDYSQSNTELMTDEIIAQLDEFKAQIIDGDIVVPEEPEAA